MPIRILHSIPSTAGAALSARSGNRISVLLILDSSFNPPTKAHAFLLRQAIQRLRSGKDGSQQRPRRTSQTQYHAAARTQTRAQSQAQAQAQARILLLLSTKNADKPSAPASVEQRVDMMRAFAQGIWQELLNERKGDSGVGAADDTDAASTATDDDDETSTLLISGIDVGLSSEPRFLEKSVFLASPLSENPYFDAVRGRRNDAEMDGDVAVSGVPQWHLLGFDTLVRLLDGKYYEPDGSLEVLAPLFETVGNRVFVMQRGDEGHDQENFVQQLNIEHDRGGFSGKGWNISWGRKVELLPAFEGVLHAGKMLETSSTAVRGAAKDGDTPRVQSMCDRRVAEYVVQEGLYKE